MANGIEFTSRVGRAFTAWVIKSTSYVTIESGTTVTEVSPGRYRVDTTADSGKVWFEATSGAVRVYGWADLDNPGANGFSDVVDSLSGGNSEILSKLNAIKGPGDQSWSISVRTTSDQPIAGCECWVTTDIAGNNAITDIQRTDANGLVEFLLDPGTYYLFRRKAGVTFNNPQSFTVT